jgi:pimeloyl-ACP methyl ester carboxylesterase
VATFGFLHGDWHDGSCWDRVGEDLRARGNEVAAPDLPFDDPGADFEARVRPLLSALEGARGQIVVVGHSSSSGYAAFAAQATSASMLVHLCPRLGPFAPVSGAPDTFRANFPFPAKNAADLTVWDTAAAVEALYPRLPDETAQALAERLHPAAPGAEYPLPGHPDVPTALVYAAEDEIFEPAWQRFMAREVLGVEPIEIPGGHFPMAEDPGALADLLVRLAAEHSPPA